MGFVRLLSFSFGVLGFRCAKEHLIFSLFLRYSEMIANGDCFEGSWGGKINQRRITRVTRGTYRENKGTPQELGSSEEVEMISGGA